MRVAVTASRSLPRSFLPIILAHLKELQATEVIHGGCEGGDLLAGEAADLLGIPQVVLPVTKALWKAQGRSAGPKRNGRIVAQKPDRGLAYHTDPGLGLGTADCVRQLRAAGVPVRVTVRVPKGLQES